jgi:hypothetical protein
MMDFNGFYGLPSHCDKYWILTITQDCSLNYDMLKNNRETYNYNML